MRTGLNLMWLVIRLAANLLFVQAGFFALNEAYNSCIRCIAFGFALQALPDMMGVLSMIYYTVVGYPSDNNDNFNPL